MRLENDQRRAQLLALGREVFGSRSYDDVSIDDIATSAGISKGLLYHYFPTKRDLYIAGLTASAEALVATANADIGQSLVGYLQWARDNPSDYRALLQGGIGSDPQVRDVVEASRAGLMNAARVAANNLNPDKENELQLRAWIGAVESATVYWTNHAQETLALESLSNSLLKLLDSALV